MLPDSLERFSTIEAPGQRSLERGASTSTGAVQALEATLDAFSQATDFETVAILLLDQDGRSLEVSAARGLEKKVGSWSISLQSLPTSESWAAVERNCPSSP